MNWKHSLIICLFAAVVAARGQGTAFTYQGRLNDAGNPAHGSYDFRFKLFEDPDGNNQAGLTVLASGLSVTNGLFAATVDFGSGLFNGSNYWLEVSVRTNGGVYQDLNPLQPVLPTPYSMFANTASNVVGTISSLSLSGTYGSPVVFNNSGNSFGGTFSGNGANVTNVNAATLNGLGASNFWNVAGNAGTTPGANFLGTSDNQPLELHVNNQRVLQLLPDNSTNNAPDLVGGSISNGVTFGLVGNTIAGGSWNTIGPAALFNTNNPYGDFSSYPAIGASYSTIGGGFLNQIQANATFSTIAGGALNTIQIGDIQSTIGGGFGNTIVTNAPWSIIGGGTHHSVSSQNGFIGGGWENIIQTNSSYASIGGGYFNYIEPYGGGSFIGGGYNNIIGPDGAGGGGSYSVIGGGYLNQIYEYYSFIGGGQQNQVRGYADHSFIGGGYQNVINGSVGPVSAVIVGGQNNVIQTNSAYAFIGGGTGNVVQSNSSYAVIPGGNSNVAGGTNSFAAGDFAQATNNGTFVWADTSSGIFNSTSNNQFLVRAAGGVGIGTNNPSGALHVAGDASGTNIALRVSSGGIAVSGAGVLTPTAAFVHVANSTNTSSYITIIYNPLCDNDPNALLFVTHNWNPPGVGGNYEAHPFSVYYANPHWAIYNDDFTSISNMSFNVLIVKR